MSVEHSYSKEVIDLKIDSIHKRFSDQDSVLEKILIQTTKHNGRLSKVERTLLIIGCVTGTLLLVNGSSFVDFILKII